jgi:hypothetical protein
MLLDRTHRKNLIAVVSIQSCGSFCAYLLAYYTKYLPGSFFSNYAMVGFADII